MSSSVCVCVFASLRGHFAFGNMLRATFIRKKFAISLPLSLSLSLFWRNSDQCSSDLYVCVWVCSFLVANFLFSFFANFFLFCLPLFGAFCRRRCRRRRRCCRCCPAAVASWSVHSVVSFAPRRLVCECKKRWKIAKKSRKKRWNSNKK